MGSSEGSTLYLAPLGARRKKVEHLNDDHN